MKHRLLTNPSESFYLVDCKINKNELSAGLALIDGDQPQKVELYDDKKEYVCTINLPTPFQQIGTNIAEPKVVFEISN